MTKRSIRAIVLILSMLLICASALATGSAPTSQFGFTGWPYRQNSSCAEDCANCQNGASCDQCPYCSSCGEDATPAPQPAEKPAVTAAPSAGTDDYTMLSLSAQEQTLLDLMNADRAQNDRAALPADQELCRLARLKACDMKENHYFAHQSPTYGTASEMLTAFGYSYVSVGENIAHHATVLKSEAAFMSSSGHRANILGSQWTRVGVGVCLDDNGFVYAVQLFAR